MVPKSRWKSSGEVRWDFTSRLAAEHIFRSRPAKLQRKKCADVTTTMPLPILVSYGLLPVHSHAAHEGPAEWTWVQDGPNAAPVEPSRYPNVITETWHWKPILTTRDGSPNMSEDDEPHEVRLAVPVDGNRAVTSRRRGARGTGESHTLT